MTLEEFFHLNRKVAVAFSGGVDSAYLLYAGIHYGASMGAYYVKSAFQPEFEFHDAKHLASVLGVNLKVLYPDVLKDEQVVENGPDRCYFCKKQMFSLVLEKAEADGFPLVADGTNFSDRSSDRPGMKVLKELGICSPLRECGLTKVEIRRRSKGAGLFTWNKPAYACLATRIIQGERITGRKLQITEMAENILFQEGFTDFRIRLRDGIAIIELREEQMLSFMTRKDRIMEQLEGYYDRVVLDMKPREEKECEILLKS